MNKAEVRLTEDALYAVKDLPGRILELQLEVESLRPPAPGSVLKMTGRPVAKTPFDTSETETWGIKRATCHEARELQAKLELNQRIRQCVDEMPAQEQEFVRLVYGKELPRHHVGTKMGINPRQYYRLRQRVIERVWERIKDYSMLEMAVV